MNNNISELNDSNYKVFLSENSSVLVDFYATWCGPCKMINPMLESIAAEQSSKTIIAKVDVEKSPEFSYLMRVKSVPSLFLFKNGEPVEKFSEQLSQKNIIQFIKDNE